MSRKLWFVVGALLLACLWVQPAWAQWPAYPAGEGNPHDLVRGPGGYVSWLKLLLIAGLYLLWTKTTDWVNRDCQMLGLPYTVWNLVVYAPFLVGFLLVLTLPLFLAGFPLLLLGYLVPLGIYIFKRNSIVDPHERVLTPAHLRHVLSNQAESMGVKIAKEKKAEHERGAPVTFTPLGGTHQQNQSNIIAARQSAGFLPAKELIADMIGQRGDKCMLDYTQDAVSVRFQIDGVWHESDPQDRENGDEMLAVFKRIANLKPEERRRRQAGRFGVELEKTKYNGTIISQGTQTGERVVLQVQLPHVQFESLEELGMREKMQQQLKDVLSKDEGIVLLSSPPGGGLTTTLTCALRLTDRYLRDFTALQEVPGSEPLTDNIDITLYDPSKGETPQKMLVSLIRKEPNAIVVPDLVNAEVVQQLCEQAVKGKLVISTVRAKEAVESLLRVLLLKVPAATFAPAAVAVLNQRLIRKLCASCKEEYEPSPQLLQKLGIPVGRVEKFYRPPEPNEQDKVCERCNGIGYYGRTAVFELLMVNQPIRQALQQQPKLDVLRQVARKTGHRSLQQEGLVLVARGVTSLQELSRVLKQ